MESLPDFVKLAESFGATGLRAENPNDLDEVIEKMIKTKSAVICDVVVDPTENCFPMIPSGAAHNEMKFKDDDDVATSTKDGKMLV